MTNKNFDKLTEDLGSEQQATDLLPTVEHLQAWHAPEPTLADTARLLSTLTSHAPTRPFSPLHLFAPALNLLRAQLYIVRREILAASALVMGIGTALGLVTSTNNSMLPDGTAAPGGLALALFSPLVAAIGVSFLYGSGIDPVVEVEKSTPISQRKILLARLTLVFGFNLALGLAGSLALTCAGLAGWVPMLNFFELVGIWLAPMTVLSAVAFLLTVISGDPLAGSAMGLTIWAAQAFRLFGSPADFMIRFPNLLAAETRPSLWLAAVGMGALAFWLAGREGQGLRRQA
jgi:hypothetical protein